MNAALQLGGRGPLEDPWLGHVTLDLLRLGNLVRIRDQVELHIDRPYDAGISGFLDRLEDLEAALVDRIVWDFDQRYPG